MNQAIRSIKTKAMLVMLASAAIFGTVAYGRFQLGPPSVNASVALDATGAVPLSSSSLASCGSLGPLRPLANTPVRVDATGALYTCGGAGGTGNVVGPASSTAHHIAFFADATGKLLEDPSSCAFGGGTLTCAGAIATSGSSDLIADGAVKFRRSTTGSTVEAATTDNYGFSDQFSGAPGVYFNGGATTISSGFGTSPSITANSTGSSGQINVGTGGAATAGVIAFSVTWSKAPFCQASVATSTAGNTRAMGAVATTTQLTLTAASAWAASSLVNWTCIAAK